MGSKAFIEETKQQLGFRAKGRKMNEREETFELREAGEDYDFMGKNEPLAYQGLRIDGLRIIDVSLVSNPYPFNP